MHSIIWTSGHTDSDRLIQLFLAAIDERWRHSIVSARAFCFPADIFNMALGNHCLIRKQINAKEMLIFARVIKLCVQAQALYLLNIKSCWHNCWICHSMVGRIRYGPEQKYNLPERLEPRESKISSWLAKRSTGLSSGITYWNARLTLWYQLSSRSEIEAEGRYVRHQRSLRCKDYLQMGSLIGI